MESLQEKISFFECWSSKKLGSVQLSSSSNFSIKLTKFNHDLAQEAPSMLKTDEDFLILY